MSVKITYEGVEIESIDTPQMFDPPRRMVTWCYRNGECCDVREQYVVAILPPLPGHVSVMCCNATTVRWAAYCAKIPVVPKPRRATNKELAKWLAQGNGEALTLAQMTNRSFREIITFAWHYFSENENEAVGYGFEEQRCKGIRKWGDDEWHEPTVDYMGIGG